MVTAIIILSAFNVFIIFEMLQAYLGWNWYQREVHLPAALIGTLVSLIAWSSLVRWGDLRICLAILVVASGLNLFSFLWGIVPSLRWIFAVLIAGVGIIYLFGVVLFNTKEPSVIRVIPTVHIPDWLVVVARLLASILAIGLGLYLWYRQTHRNT